MSERQHILCRCQIAALLVAVWVVQQVGHGEEGVIEDAGGNSPVLSVDQQHAFQQGHKLPPVSLLCLHVPGVRTQHQVHLRGGSTGEKHTSCEKHAGQQASQLLELCRNDFYQFQFRRLEVNSF